MSAPSRRRGAGGAARSGRSWDDVVSGPPRDGGRLYCRRPRCTQTCPGSTASSAPGPARVLNGRQERRRSADPGASLPARLGRADPTVEVDHAEQLEGNDAQPMSAGVRALVVPALACSLVCGGAVAALAAVGVRALSGNAASLPPSPGPPRRRRRAVVVRTPPAPPVTQAPTAPVWVVPLRVVRAGQGRTRGAGGPRRSTRPCGGTLGNGLAVTGSVRAGPPCVARSPLAVGCAVPTVQVAATPPPRPTKESL